MSKWEKVRLGDVATVVSGSTPPTSDASFWDGHLNWVTPAELSDEVVYVFETQRKITEKAIQKGSMRLLPSGTVLLSSRAPIGKVAIAGVDMYCNQGFKNLVCSEVVFNKFLFWYLKGKKEYLNSLGRGATFKEISKGIVENILIPLPTLAFQRQIAHDLDNVSELLTLRKQQLEEFDQLIKSVFYELFGDPVMNGKRWEVSELRNVVKFIQGTQVPLEDQLYEYMDHSIRFLRISDYTQEGDGYRYIIPSGKEFVCNEDDVIMVRYGASAGYVGCGFVGVIANNLFAISPTSNNLSKRYLLYYLRNEGIQNYIIKSANQSAMPALSHKNIGKIRVMVPPIILQNKFAEIVTQIEAQKALVKQSIDETQRLFDSLMSKYFDD